MPDFSAYVPPGVYVEDVSTPLTTVQGTIPQVVTLVGPGQGYLQATTTAVLTSADTDATPAPVVLPHALAYVTGDNAPVVTNVNGDPLVAGTDYEATVDSDGLLNLLRLAASTNYPSSDYTVTVTYRWTDPGYYTAQLFTDYDAVVAYFGQPLYQPSPGTASSDYPADQIVSPLAFAAKIAFENGANQVLCVGTPSGSAEDIRDGYGQIDTDLRVSVVVPLPTDVDSLASGQQYGTDLKNHCVNANNDGLPRVGVLGMSAAFTETGGYSNFATLATGLNSPRVIVAYPESLLYYNGYTNQTLVVPGYYLAAAYAGRLESVSPNKPLTKEVIASFAGLPATVLQALTRAVKDELATAGVALVEQDRFNRIVVRHGVTSAYNGGLYQREISLIRQRDALFSVVQSGLDASGIIGQPITLETPLSVKSVVAGLLNSAEQQEVILTWNDLLVRVQSGDPSVVEVKFSYKPAVPLNYVTVSFSLDVSTGDFTSTDLTTTTAA